MIAIGETSPGAALAPGAPRRRAAARRAWRGGIVLVAGAWVVAAAGCMPMPPQMLTLRGSLDSLRTQVDTLTVRDSIAFRMLLDARTELIQQRDILLSTRATTGSTTKDLFDQMSRLEGKLDEAMGRFQQIHARESTPAVPGGPDPNVLYDEAMQDLTQGRYGLARSNFREFLGVAPGSELADNAQYGVGETYFAEARYDSAAVEYQKVETIAPKGDKVPAALYKLALSQEKLGQTAESKKTLEALVQRFPLAGEAQLARERILSSSKRH